MQKIPVGRTIARAYSFGFGEFLSLIGIAWLPFLVMWVSSLLLLGSFRSNMAAIPVGGTPQERTAAMLSAYAASAPSLLLVTAITVVCFSMVLAGMTEQALGLRANRTFVYFSLDKKVWRLIASFILLGLAFLAIGVVLIIALGIGGVLLSLAVKGLAGTAAKAAVGLAVLFAFFVIYGAFIYIAARFTFLLIPSVIAEHKITIFSGWQLTRGNFWRIFVIVLAIIVPFLFVGIAYLLLTIGLPPLHIGSTPSDVQAWSQQVRAWSARSQEMSTIQFIAIPLWIVIYTVYYGVTVGASAFAYRALKPEGDVAETFS